MKIIVVDGDGHSMGEMKLDAQLLRRPSLLSERLEGLISRALRERRDDSTQERIVETVRGGLETLDEDGTILDVPLRLDEACSLDFLKHVESITASEDRARLDHQERYGKLNYAQENAKRYDSRYKERPLNRMRVK